MVIFVLYRRGELIVEPDIAVVPVGQQIEWLLMVDDPNIAGSPLPLEWTIYFDHGTPFSASGPGVPQKEFSTNANAGDKGQVKPPPPRKPGKYKYGIKVKKSGQFKPLVDKDPTLEITP